MNKMTVLNGVSLDSDQQVPDTSVNIVTSSGNSGGTLTSIQPPSTGLKALPSLSAIFDSGSLASLDTPELIMNTEFSYPAQLLDNQWELSMYEGLSYIKQEKEEPESPKCEEPIYLSESQESNDVLCSSSASMLSSSESVLSSSPSELSIAEEEKSVALPVADDDMVMKLEEICKRFWIPKDPFIWTPKHVKNWVSGILREKYMTYNSVCTVELDGPNLCKMSEDDFCEWMGNDGQYLFHELNWWKMVVWTEKQVGGEEQITYTDLTNSSPNNSSTDPTLNLTSCSTLNTTNLLENMQVFPEIDFKNSTLYEINTDIVEHQQQSNDSVYNNSFNNSQSSSMSWDDTTSNDVSFNRPLNSSSDQTEDDASDDEEMANEQRRRRYVSHSKHTIHLWQFLKNLLDKPDLYGSYIKWLDIKKGIFKIENSAEVATLWGERKNRPKMNYDKLSRSIRQYYKKGIIKKTNESKRLVYQFQPNYL